MRLIRSQRMLVACNKKRRRVSQVIHGRRMSSYVRSDRTTPSYKPRMPSAHVRPISIRVVDSLLCSRSATALEFWGRSY